MEPVVTEEEGGVNKSTKLAVTKRRAQPTAAASEIRGYNLHINWRAQMGSWVRVAVEAGY